MEIPINKRIELLLNHYKITQKKLAEKAGLSENTISNAKKGKNVPNVDFFNSIYKAFPTINPKWLYLGIGNMFNDEGVNLHVLDEHPKDVHENCRKIIKNLETEINYLKIQIRDKEEIIHLLRNSYPNN